MEQIQLDVALEMLSGRRRNGPNHNRHVLSAFGSGFTFGAKGAMGEMLVSVDLMKRGYSVFRAVSPETPFDLVAAKGDQLLRIECRCGSLHAKTGTLSFTRTTPRTGVALPDHYAVVVDEQVTYEPPLEG
jgi:hypothetical protein